MKHIQVFGSKERIFSDCDENSAGRRTCGPERGAGRVAHVLPLMSRFEFMQDGLNRRTDGRIPDQCLHAFPLNAAKVIECDGWDKRDRLIRQ